MILFLIELRYKSDLHRFRFRSPMKEGTSQKYIIISKRDKISQSVQ
jgi:hypothetical protein